MAVKSLEVKNGKFAYVVSASIRTANGKRIQRKRYSTNRPAAKALERQLIQELSELKNGKKSLTWNEFLPIYFHEMTESKRKQPSTLENEKHNLQKHVTPVWGALHLKTINPEEVRKLINQAVGDKTPQTKKHLASNIRAVFNLATEFGYVAKNPAQFISFKVPKRHKKLPSLEQIKKVITEAKAKQLNWYYLWHFLALTGCRSGEAFALRWHSIDIPNDTITIAESWTRKGGFRGATKNGEWRTIPINAELKELLLELKSKNDGSNNSFVLPRIREWTQGEAAKSLQLFLKCLDIPAMRLHDFRAVFITEMLRAGKDIPTVMRLVDHKRLETCLMYVALAGLDVAKATDNLTFLSRES